ncbi:hypothetical protein BIV24_12000 [Streptomyces colonosanans]|uniref:Mutator family transposase n=1 Tax=Streptomyces colonosanans TaxID=1428652 RepID=A0A1S2PI63_9ACTN|nr:hypothetical protein BIV24_12000 [Streptomyces colonosanans]
MHRTGQVLSVRVATLLRTIFEQPDTDAVKARMRHVLDALEAKFPKAAAHLDAAQHDRLAFTAFPREIWRQIWSNNPQERLNKEIRRRTDVVDLHVECGDGGLQVMRHNRNLEALVSSSRPNSGPSLGRVRPHAD